MRLVYHKRILSWLTVGLLLASASASARIPDSIFSYRDTNFRPMWNGVNFDQFWSIADPYTTWNILYPGTDTATLTATGDPPGGVDRIWINLIWAFNAEYSPIDSLNQMDFEIRFRFRLANPTAGTTTDNSGLHVRSRCRIPSYTFANMCGGGRQVSGPQIELGVAFSWDILNWPSARYMGADMVATPPAVNNTAACRTAGHAEIWQHMGIRILNDTMSTLKFDASGNETLCAKYKLTATNDVAVTSPGMFALDYQRVSIGPEFRDIRIKNLRAVPGPVAVRSGQSPAMRTLRAERGALVFDISAPGAFRVTVADPRGKTVARLQGNGPVAQARLPLKNPGLYLVRVVSPQGSAMRTVIVP
jgi:hypothetical protein